VANKTHRIIITGTYVDNISKGVKKTVKFMKRQFAGAFRFIKMGFVAVGKAAKAGFRALKRAAKIGLIAITAVTIAIGKMIFATAAFREGLLEIKTLGVAKSIRDLGDEVLALTATFGQTQTSTIKAYYDAISAGIKESQVFAFLKDASKAAIAGVTDIGTATDALTSVLNAYQLGAEKASFVSDAFFGAIKVGKTTFAELAESIGTVAPLAFAGGVGLKELMAVIAGITKVGLPTTLAITGVKAMITQLLKPSVEATAAAKRLGIEWGASALKAKGLAGILQELAENADIDTEATALLFGNVRGLGPALALMSNDANILKESMKVLGASTGSVNKAFAIMSENNPALDMRKLKEQIIGTFTRMGRVIITSDAFRKALTRISNEVDKIADSGKLEEWTEKGINGLERFVNYIKNIVIPEVRKAWGIIRAIVNDPLFIGNVFESIGQTLFTALQVAWKAFATLVRGSINFIFKPMFLLLREEIANIQFDLGQTLASIPGLGKAGREIQTRALNQRINIRNERKEAARLGTTPLEIAIKEAGAIWKRDWADVVEKSKEIKKHFSDLAEKAAVVNERAAAIIEAADLRHRLATIQVDIARRMASFQERGIDPASQLGQSIQSGIDRRAERAARISQRINITLNIDTGGAPVDAAEIAEAIRSEIERLSRSGISN
jgi:TP901 family phage tail tape measure protein